MSHWEGSPIFGTHPTRNPEFLCHKRSRFRCGYSSFYWQPTMTTKSAKATLSPARYLERQEAELIGFLQKLIRLRTVNPPGENYGEITLLLRDALRDAGLET